MILANRVDGLSDDALLDCFISGLKELIRRDVIEQSPKSLLRAVSLARLYDVKVSLGSSTRVSRLASLVSGKPSSFVSSTSHSSIAGSTSSSTPLFPTPVTKPLSSIKRISSAEMQIHREKGLCFTCDEKYTWNHKCPNKHLMLLFTDSDDCAQDSSLEFVPHIELEASGEPPPSLLDQVLI